MIPVRLQLVDFMTHTDTDLDFTSFQSALVLGRMVNDDRRSNGVGKSTLFNAIEYALFGVVPFSVLEKAIRNGTERCQVTLDFDLIQGRYRVLRARSRKGRSELRLWKWDDTQSEFVSISERTMPETDQRLSELVGLTHKAFQYSIRFAQNDMGGLAAATTPDQRRAILKEPLQLTDYTRLEKIAKKRQSAVRADLDRIQGALGLLGDPGQSEREAKDGVATAKKAMEEGQLAHLLIQKGLKEKRSRQTQLQSSLGSDDADLYQRYDTARKAVERSTSAAKRLRGRRDQQVTDAASAKKKSERCRETVAALETERDEAEDPGRPVAEVDQAIEEIAKLREKVSRESAEAKAEAEAISQLPPDDTCPTCRQGISAAHRDECGKAVADRLSALADVKKTADLEYTQATKDLHGLADEKRVRLEYDRWLQRLTSDLTAQGSALVAAEQAFSQGTARVTELLADIEEEEASLAGLQEEVASLEKRLGEAGAGETNKELVAVSEAICKDERDLENSEDRLVRLHGAHGAALGALKAATERVEKARELATEFKKKDKAHTLHKLVADAFSPKGIPNFIINSVLGELQAEAGRVLFDLRPEMQLAFGTDLSISYTVFGQPLDYDQLSGGQKVYVAFALKMGLSRVIQKRLGVDVRFLALDEVDQSLDQAGVDAFADVVRSWQNDFKILVITHNESLKDRFSHVVLVEGDQNLGASARLVGT